MTKVNIHPAADEDFLESYLYYSQYSKAAADEFDEQVRAAYEKIAAKPMSGTALDENYRFYTLKNYPHLVL